MQFRFKTLSVFATFTLLVSVWLPMQAQAVPLVSWSITGPGTTSATPISPYETDLSYDIDRGPFDFFARTWEVRATAPAAGDYEFDWTYEGFHANFGAEAFLTAIDPNLGNTSLIDAGPVFCCISPANGFSFTGNFLFSGISAGQSFGFDVGGDNLDFFDNDLSGTLSLTQVPEPGTLAILGFGLAMIGFARRRVVTGG